MKKVVKNIMALIIVSSFVSSTSVMADYIGPLDGVIDLERDTLSLLPSPYDPDTAEAGGAVEEIEPNRECISELSSPYDPEISSNSSDVYELAGPQTDNKISELPKVNANDYNYEYKDSYVNEREYVSPSYNYSNGYSSSVNVNYSVEGNDQMIFVNGPEGLNDPKYLADGGGMLFQGYTSGNTRIAFEHTAYSPIYYVVQFSNYSTNEAEIEIKHAVAASYILQDSVRDSDAWIRLWQRLYSGQNLNIPAVIRDTANEIVKNPGSSKLNLHPQRTIRLYMTDKGFSDTFGYSVSSCNFEGLLDIKSSGVTVEIFAFKNINNVKGNLVYRGVPDDCDTITGIAAGRVYADVNMVISDDIKEGNYLPVSINGIYKGTTYRTNNPDGEGIWNGTKHKLDDVVGDALNFTCKRAEKETNYTQNYRKKETYYTQNSTNWSVPETSNITIKNNSGRSKRLTLCISGNVIEGEKGTYQSLIVYNNDTGEKYIDRLTDSAQREVLTIEVLPYSQKTSNITILLGNMSVSDLKLSWKLTKQ